ncbi:MAG: carbon storage regulator [Planctomycetaceae bacterium]|nr:carbon storage regulator [Planctomycetaceae bacterium]
MLVLSRKTNEKVLIGDEIELTIIRVGPSTVRIGIQAPKHVSIVREELTFREPANLGQSGSALAVH